MSGQTICILYGLNEGPGMGRKLAAALQKASFRLTRDPATVDIIFAHSGGCLLIPPVNRAKLIVLSGIPYWPGRSWFASTVHKVRREAATCRRERRLGQWGLKWLYHLLYALNLPAGIRIAKNLALTSPWNSVQPQVIIRNRYDEYCCPEITDVPFNGPRTFISLPGEHDDCWDHPQRYVSLLQSMYKE